MARSSGPARKATRKPLFGVDLLKMEDCGPELGSEVGESEDNVDDDHGDAGGNEQQPTGIPTVADSPFQSTSLQARLQAIDGENRADAVVQLDQEVKVGKSFGRKSKGRPRHTYARSQSAPLPPLLFPRESSARPGWTCPPWPLRLSSSFLRPTSRLLPTTSAQART